MYELNNEQISKIKEIIEAYKGFMLTKQGIEETFKWEALSHFQKNWDIDAPDFAKMLEHALSKTDILLTSGIYYPREMLMDCAKMDSEKLRQTFRKLYDNERTLPERFVEFTTDIQVFTDEMIRRDGKQRKHFQDARAVLWYLALRFPELYFPYKPSVYQNAIKLLDVPVPKAKHRTAIWKAGCAQELFRLVLEQVLQDEELLQKNRERLGDMERDDPKQHFLVFDIMYFAEQYMEEKQASGEYWPTLDEYDPEISTEEWKEVLQDSTVTYSDSLKMLAMMMQEGGESTCAHLAETYGGTSDFFNLNGRMFAGRVKKKLNSPDCLDDDVCRVFPVVFQGRHVVENNYKRYSWRIRDELQEALKMMELPTYDKHNPEPAQKFSKNMILYGPPGTGKTFHTILYAVAIIEGKSLESIKAEPYEEVRQRYQVYKAENRVAFTTFHQSYGYEDFIEGIRPTFPDDGSDESATAVRYQVVPGAFRKFCENATNAAITEQADYQLNKNPVIWKVSLERTGDNDTRAECMEHDHIRIGWDDYGEDLSTLKDYYQGGDRILNTFYNRMEIGDLVFSCYSATQIDAIGVITGAPEWDDTLPNYRRIRKVHWLAKGLREDIQEINGGHAMVQGTVYQLWRISLEDANKLIEKHSKTKKTAETPTEKPYVFIIDEINRGNIAKIFGELITLLEDNKRIGAGEETRVRLPYSDKPFGVPQNVYVIGTMNTADRSIMALDTALRRRFSFVEMLPEPETVLKDVTVEENGKTIEVDKLLSKLNQRIEALYDREHTIGHAYFIPLKNEPDMAVLAEIFTDQVIPLLQEYFFDDYEKIRLVLGDNQKTAGGGTEFIKLEAKTPQDLFGSADIQQELQPYYMIDKEAAKNPEAYEFLR